MGTPARPVTATYRLQMNRDFTFGDALGIVPYLKRLGISHLYISPISKARAGSIHGYDVVNPNMLNPELGSEDDLRILVENVHRHGMGIIADIVPNHMAVGSENLFWEDVLAHGRYSPYADWFDVDWEAVRRIQHRIIIPILAEPLRNIVQRGEVKLVFNGENFRVEYFANSLPVDPQTLPVVLDLHSAGIAEQGIDPAELAAFRDAIEDLRRLPKHYEKREGTDRWRISRDALSAVADLYAKSQPFRGHIDRVLREFQDATHAALFAKFLEAQPYRLSFWRRAMKDLNYRRFFDINDLIALRVEEEQVFKDTHGLILNLVAEGSLDALRVDHIDGLLDPAVYLRRLRDAVRERSPYDNFPIFVEKILSHQEKMPLSWPVDGTTGYDFISSVEPAFTDALGFKRVDHFYAKFTRSWENFSETAVASKRKILISLLTTDVKRVFFKMDDAACDMEEMKGTAPTENARAIVEFIAMLPVYRTYLSEDAPQGRPADRVLTEEAIENCKNIGKATPVSVAVLEKLLLNPPSIVDPDLRLQFIKRLQQLSGPATAKGIEDTAFYRYFPLAHLNEVGGTPEAELSGAVQRFHDTCGLRSRQWPRSMLALSTHDTKRSADARARLAVIAEAPFVWERHVRRWHQTNVPHFKQIERLIYPDRNTEYLLYQMLLAAWPPELEDLSNGAELRRFEERIQLFMLKAAREAKLQTSWIQPVAKFEKALAEFIRVLFDPKNGLEVLTEILALGKQTDAAARITALSVRLLQLTAPGFPDIYQGDEYWSFRMVDPDNRLSVDYEVRRRDLESLPEDQPAVGLGPLNLNQTKLSLIASVLRARRDHPELFLSGGYSELRPHGLRSENVVAFLRETDDEAAIVAVPRKVFSLCSDGNYPGRAAWDETFIEIPERLKGRRFRSCLNDDEITLEEAELSAGRLFLSFPGALLIAVE